jgi:endogenous inhibitor of DNA gyrase (YacG/DUF329 family)
MSSPAPTPPHIVRCPSCGGPSVYAPSNAYRPFCSERCKLQDLSAWASERYAVEARSDPDGDEESPFEPNPAQPSPPQRSG